ncbi:primary-amine oxidase [uncultured Albimonas sp.]|uniref:primary-amine oxidase n=1 Tax=uncultured Albimonas sp. TaxID=1331701 RepID=UPI0030ECB133
MNKPETPIAADHAPTHPLEPLTESEIAAAAALVRAARATEALRFEMIELKEPSKKKVRAFEPGDDFPREARVNVFEMGRIGVWKYVVSLSAGRILSETFVEGARPMIMAEEFLQIEATVKENPEFQAACAKRGIEDVSLVCVDPWSAGNFGVEGEEGKHVAHTFCWVKSGPYDNLYAHPIEGLNPVVDVKKMEVIRIDDYGVREVPKEDVNYEAQFQDGFRKDLKPIDVVQPEGVSFDMDGRRITWADWDLVIGFNGREGLTLHDVKLDGRPVFYRLSIAEMVVPYGSPAKQHARKNVFDIGEYGLGKLANSLELGCDCLGAIHYLDGYVSGIDGAPEKIRNAICIHEEDDGVLWKHWDFRTDRTEVRRARKLVISSISTVGNYEYASYWYFMLDGTIEFEMKATGIINTVGCEPGNPGKYGTEVAPGVLGQIHQHTFCARIDLAVDGDACTVVECDTIAPPMGPENPYGNAFYIQETPLAQEGGRARAPEKERYWKFVSAQGKNRMGRPTAFKLEPTRSITAFNKPQGPSGSRMPFIYKDLWVTAYDPEERFPAGEFMNHSDGSEGIPAWIAKQRPVEGADIVAWHVFGLHHMPRLEDFPVQPVVKTGFTLMPNGFFDMNPALNMPPERNEASTDAGCCGGIAAE